jgi:hypothetical protein
VGECLISDGDTGEHLCALVCDTDSDCPKRATCKDLGGASICTYDDATPTPPPTPPVPTPVPGTTHYGDPYRAGGCLADEDVETLDEAKGIKICSPQCVTKGLSRTCPSDVPGGATGNPECDLVDKVNKTKLHHCALGCAKKEDCGADTKTGTSKCLIIPTPDGNLGFCYYEQKTETVASLTFDLVINQEAGLRFEVDHRN